MFTFSSIAALISDSATLSASADFAESLALLNSAALISWVFEIRYVTLKDSIL